MMPRCRTAVLRLSAREHVPIARALRKLTAAGVHFPYLGHAADASRRIFDA